MTRLGLQGNKEKGIYKAAMLPKNKFAGDTVILPPVFEVGSESKLIGARLELICLAGSEASGLGFARRSLLFGWVRPPFYAIPMLPRVRLPYYKATGLSTRAQQT